MRSSTILSPKTKTQAKRQYRLKTYPDYLILHVQKKLTAESSQSAVPPVSFDEAVFSELIEMGFTADSGKRALLRTKSENVEVALN